MAKRYGGRWELVDGPRLGDGGQSQVFRVPDVNDPNAGEFALKRVIDITRRERFRREVEAIKRLTGPEAHQAHPNIISLIDHSALDETDDEDKQYLVMPIAEGSDLGKDGRVALYKDSIDGVVVVAKQVTAALIAAHAANIIHRDVKRKNILFTGNGHEIWLTDFGICLIREAPRITELPEVMGPREFMAPELAGGGQLDVTSAADLYSLGKLIYFMISGGITLPREQLHEPPYNQVFARGERYGLLELLLRRMVCPLQQRIQSAADVMKELEKIEAWEQNALLLPMSGTARAAVDQFKRRSLETGRIAAENAAARQTESQTLGALQLSVTSWLKAELEKIASVMASDSIRCTVQDAGLPDGLRIPTGHSSMYREMNGVELTVEDINDPMGRVHVLQFFLCRHFRVVVTVHSGPGPIPPQSAPARDVELAVIATYVQGQKHENRAPQPGFVSRSDQVGKTRGQLQFAGPGKRQRGLGVQHYQVRRIGHSFHKDVSLHTAFRASEWPGNEEALRAMFTEAVEVFVTEIGA